MLVGAIVAFDGPDSLACSGPGAAGAIRTSILIGRSFVGVSAAFVAAGSIYLSRRSIKSPIGWLLAALALQPGWWMSASHGDCGYSLRFWSFLGTIWIAGAVVLAICWPLSIDAQSKRWRWRTAGALAGSLFGVLVALSILLKDPGARPPRQALSWPVQLWAASSSPAQWSAAVCFVAEPAAVGGSRSACEHSCSFR